MRPLYLFRSSSDLLPLKALPYWHLTFFTICFWRPEEMTVFSSAWTICLFRFQNFNQIWRRLPSKGKPVKDSLWIASPLLKMEVNLKWWDEVYLLKIFYWGSKWDLEQSTVYVIYSIQESRSLENHVLEPLNPYKNVPSNQPNFCIDFIYIVRR